MAPPLLAPFGYFSAFGSSIQQLFYLGGLAMRGFVTRANSSRWRSPASSCHTTHVALALNAEDPAAWDSASGYSLSIPIRAAVLCI